jgi:PPK2 family polyphosphate:nucleotide phosphotransferase
MQKKKALKKIESFISPYRITNGKSFRLSDVEPSDTHGLASESKEEAKELLAVGIEWLAELQDKLSADDRWGLLLIFQAMDAAGKDGTIKHVMSGVNPQGCQVFSFKQPSVEELDHDYMWRYMRCLPERGRIGIFNRSYYEEVLVVRVHEELLDKQRMPHRLITKKIWQERLEDIANFERYLSRNGIVVLKFFLHVSRKEQKRRFLERLDRSDKNWKFSNSDIAEREHWKSYMKAYEQAIQATACDHAPWYVVPADNKWYTRLVVAAAIVDCMSELGLDYPAVTDEMRASLIAARNILSSDKS